MHIEKLTSNSVSYVRVAALFAIIICHMMQALDNKWAWVMNIGVQVFLFISGFLYGHMNASSWLGWYKRRFYRIYIPFIQVVFLYILVYLLCATKTLALSRIFSYVVASHWFNGWIPGIEHLWFITAILMCYMTTPVLQSLKSIHIPVLFLIFGFSLYELFVVKYDIKVFIPLFIYAFGFFYASFKGWWKYGIISLLCALSVFLLWQLTWEDILDHGSLMNQVFHTYCGITISVILVELFSNVLKVGVLNRFVSFFDKHSYEIYLVHHPFIIGPFSLIGLTPFVILNISAILGLTFIMAFLLKRLVNFELSCMHI